MLLSAQFLIVRGAALGRGVDLQCGCFGPAFRGLSGSWEWPLDLFMLGASLLLLRSSSSRNSPKRVIGGLAALALLNLGILVWLAPAPQDAERPPPLLTQAGLDSDGPASALALDGPPDLAFEPEVLSLGNVESGGLTSGTVRVTNRGSEPLELTEVGLSCGCTNRLLWPKGLEAQASCFSASSA